MSGLHEIRCCKQVKTQGTSMHWHQCFCVAKVRRGEEWFCSHHDPVAVQARSDARSAKWKAESDAKLARWKKEAADRKRAELCVAACAELTDDEVRNGIPKLREFFK